MDVMKLYRLTEARELRGLTVSELADEIGISKQVVYKYENGTTRPSAETLEKISQVLQFPVSFFERPRTRETITSQTVFFRSLESTLAKQRKQAFWWIQLLTDQVSYYEQYMELPEVHLPSFDIDYTKLKGYDIDDIAMQVRKYWGLGNAPISNMTLLLENNGFIISYQNLGIEELDACSVVLSGRPYIVVNTTKETCSRIIMNLAHELGHIILHTQVESEDIASKPTMKLIENQAWRFAGSFLLPPVSFIRETVYVTLDYFKVLKSRWRVSIAAMIMHCYDLGIIDEFKKQYLFREYARKKYKRFEPLDDSIPIEKPETLLNCDRLMIQEGGYSKRDLLDAVGLCEADYAALISAPEGYFDPAKPKLRLLT